MALVLGGAGDGIQEPAGSVLAVGADLHGGVADGRVKVFRRQFEVDEEGLGARCGLGGVGAGEELDDEVAGIASGVLQVMAFRDQTAGFSCVQGATEAGALGVGRVGDSQDASCSLEAGEEVLSLFRCHGGAAGSGALRSRTNG
ncbi:hypothetical protein [Streptomyces sp. CA-132043]|uniref:hypothetical protein n=1 Tax=Streptomyces sp. CA-132043 TaxID=3240048 RepID=UPI003D926873